MEQGCERMRERHHAGQYGYGKKQGTDLGGYKRGVVRSARVPKRCHTVERVPASTRAVGLAEDVRVGDIPSDLTFWENQQERLQMMT